MARKPGSKIPLLGINGEHVRYVTLRQAYQLIDGEQAVDVSGWRNRKDAPLKAIKLVSPRSSKGSPAYISPAESDLNAGAMGEFQHNDDCDCAECMAVLKVREWPNVGDTRAVRVGIALPILA